MGKGFTEVERENLLDRHCPMCGEKLYRRREASGRLESWVLFSRRSFCSLLCSNARFRKNPNLKPTAPIAKYQTAKQDEEMLVLREKGVSYAAISRRFSVTIESARTKVARARMRRIAAAAHALPYGE